MKKLMSISLVLILAGGVLMSENTKAEAMDPVSAALVAGAILTVPPFLAALAHGPYYGPAPVYGGGYYGYGGGYYARPYYARPYYGRGYYGGGHHDGGHHGGGHHGGGHYGGGHRGYR
jgi:hypothetical protein